MNAEESPVTHLKKFRRVPTGVEISGSWQSESLSGGCEQFMDDSSDGQEGGMRIS